MSSNMQPSATTNKARHLLRKGGGCLQNQRGHNRILTSYDAVHLTDCFDKLFLISDAKNIDKSRNSI